MNHVILNDMAKIQTDVIHHAHSEHLDLLSAFTRTIRPTRASRRWERLRVSPQSLQGPRRGRVSEKFTPRGAGHDAPPADGSFHVIRSRLRAVARRTCAVVFDTDAP